MNPRSRVNEVWEANFNGYPIVGRITKSQFLHHRYDYYPWGKYEVWTHFVKIVSSPNENDIGKTRKWKEDIVFEKCMRRVWVMQWEMSEIPHGSSI